MIDATTFRDVMAQWPSGVTIVTMLDAEGRRHGMTASSFSSVSLDPPLVSICLATTLYSRQLVESGGIFGVSVLAKDQAAVARRFAGQGDVADRFEGEQWTTARTGAPLLESALGWVDCRVLHAYPGGDHTIFVGEVLAGHAAGRSAPLLFHSRGWGQFADVLPDVATLSDAGAVAGLTVAGAASLAAGAAAAIAASGVRVRVADLSGAADAQQAADMVPRTLPLQNASALVADRTQADLALDAGMGTVELVVDPADPVATAALYACIAGIEGRTSVQLLDPFDEGRLPDVLAAVCELSRLRVAEIGLPDTAGRATPLQVRRVLQEVVALARPVPVRMRLHDRDRLGLVKAITALKSGVCHFDATICGIDEAVATEDLIRLLQEVDVGVPVDVPALDELARTLRAGIADPSVTVPSGAANIVGAVG